MAVCQRLMLQRLFKGVRICRYRSLQGGRGRIGGAQMALGGHKGVCGTEGGGARNDKGAAVLA